MRNEVWKEKLAKQEEIGFFLVQAEIAWQPMSGLEINQLLLIVNTFDDDMVNRVERIVSAAKGKYACNLIPWMFLPQLTLWT